MLFSKWRKAWVKLDDGHLVESRFMLTNNRVVLSRNYAQFEGYKDGMTSHKCAAEWFPESEHEDVAKWRTSAKTAMGS